MEDAREDAREGGKPQQPRSSRAQNATSWRVRDESSGDGAAQSYPQPPRYNNPRNSRPGSDRSDRQQPSTADPSTRLYVGNLPYQALSKDVEELFADNGFSVVKIDISTDPFTGRNPSYCFVELESSGEAERAMQDLSGKEILGRPVRVKPHVARSSNPGSNPRIKPYEQGAGRPSQRFSPMARGSEGGGDGPAGNKFDRWSRNDASSHWSGVSDQGRRLYVGGLPRIEPHSTVEAEMHELFKDFEITAVSKIISPHESKASIPGNHYYLFVDFPTPEGANSAVSALNGTESKWGGNLRINKAKGDSRRVQREQLSRDDA